MPSTANICQSSFESVETITTTRFYDQLAVAALPLPERITNMPGARGQMPCQVPPQTSSMIQFVGGILLNDPDVHLERFNKIETTERELYLFTFKPGSAHE